MGNVRELFSMIILFCLFMIWGPHSVMLRACSWLQVTLIMVLPGPCAVHSMETWFKACKASMLTPLYFWSLTGDFLMYIFQKNTSTTLCLWLNPPSLLHLLSSQGLTYSFFHKLHLWHFYSVLYIEYLYIKMPVCQDGGTCLSVILAKMVWSWRPINVVYFSSLSKQPYVANQWLWLSQK